MLSEGTQRLADDHVALDELLRQLKAALDREDVDTAHAKLDLFWAKLAVHIRAEHLHLFPCVLNGEDAVIEQLREDHEYFMRQLASAIETIRSGQDLSAIRNILLEIQQRLVHHNQVEESNVYHRATTVLNAEELEELSQRISNELNKRPSRFTAESWTLSL